MVRFSVCSMMGSGKQTKPGATNSCSFVLQQHQLISSCSSCIRMIVQYPPEYEKQLHPVLQLLQPHQHQGVVRIARHSIFQLEERAVLCEENLLSVLAARLVQGLNAVLDPRGRVGINRASHDGNISPDHLCRMYKNFIKIPIRIIRKTICHHGALKHFRL